MKRIVITGPPFAGKSSVIGELRKQGYNVVDESAREILNSLRNLKFIDPHKNKRDYFQREVVLHQIKIEDEKVFLHLDIGRHPERYSQAISLAVPRSITLFNRDITNITKNYTENMYVGMGGPTLSIKNPRDYKGKVILKSILNAGDPLGRGYRIMDSGEVSKDDWDNLETMVQPFISSKKDEATNEFGRMDRHVIFLGESAICSFYSKDPIIKRKASIWEYFRDIQKLDGDFKDQKRVCLNELGVSYRRLSNDERRNQKTIMKYAKLIGLDFGSIDTITDYEGNLHILDVNKTPWERGIPRTFINIFRGRIK